jgi:phosphopantothenoylcysteine decarboxylase/phosphopantothenate--cysteine ligase
MNTGMWESPATRANIECLVSRKVRVLDVGQGELACGTVGAGRLLDPPAIVDAVAEALPK